jgi:hypothetical protein
MDIDQTDFLTTWGREFSSAVDDVATASGQDAYEVYIVAFGVPAQLDHLQRLTAHEICLLRDAAREVLEAPAIDTAHMEEAVRRTIAQYA